MPLVSISNSQRRPMPPVNWAATIYHGLPLDVCRYSPRTGQGYFAFLGRISPEKRLDRAIEIARATGTPLKVAAKIDRADQAYFDAQIRPLLRDRLVEFVGEIGESEKSAFLGGAKALLFPIDWPEPFGLVMIESMSCGTPILAWNCGSVPEIIEPGVNGYIVESMHEAVAAARAIGYLDRGRVRQSFERRFSAEQMARTHLDLYTRMLQHSEMRICNTVNMRAA
jgi:glycosyltransferase involved in cell wall biosynthesis